ncbi:MAG: ABC transporter substrate-binding protein, partial [Chloroflexi bacterium]|nr:ABC transporter substrate-binding protein [Chloroflexota bacterium]
HVEALDSHTVKVYFNQMPGLSVWQYGLAFTPILPKHYWEPIVTAAKQAGEDIESMQAALFSHEPMNEPTAGGFVFKRWEPGAFYETASVENWYKSGIVVEEYANGAYREFDPNNGYDVSYYGQPAGAKSLEFEYGPHIDGAVFNIYSDQDSAILALTNGDIDYVLNSSGLSKGFQDRVKAAPDLALVSNPANGVRYLGFNTRKAPMDSKNFRQAVATIIDKEFVSNTVLQGAAIPTYSMVPPGNAFWHNPDVPKVGQGLSLTDRVNQAVQLLKDAGFTYDVEPQVAANGLYVEVRGKGLKMADGTPVPQMTIMAPASAYDPLRTTFSIWIDRWLNDIGIPASVELMPNNSIAGALFSETAAQDVDMWILGWSLRLFPDYLYDYFHSGNATDGSFLNWGGYSNPQFDQLSAELLTVADIDQARSKIFELQEFLAEDMPYVVLFSPPMFEAYRPSKIQFPYTSALGGIQFYSGMQKIVLID